MRIHSLIGFLCGCLLVSTAWAQPLGTAFTYQGRLNNGGSPADGSFNMDFKLYSVATGGAPLASQSLPGVSVSDGLFTVQVDFGPGMFSGNQRWLEVIVNGSTLVPRQPLTAAPHAQFAANADRLDGLDSTAFLTGIPNPLSLTGTHDAYVISGNNLSTVNGASGVFGSSTGATGQVYGVQGHSGSTNGFGVFGVATSTTGPSRGGFFESASPEGIGALGLAKATTGATAGLYGQSDSSSGSGVFGIATATSGSNAGVTGQTASAIGFGVQGYASNANGPNIGGFFRSDGSSGRAVYGYANHATGLNFGVVGETASTSGRGVYGYATAATGQTFGGSFENASSSQDATGVFGLASAFSGITYGVWGKSNSTSGYGVVGINDRATGTTYGVYGRSGSADGYGVYGLCTDVSNGLGVGVRGVSNSQNGTGVSGVANATNGLAYGVEGISYSSNNGYGVRGIAAATSGFTFGVYGRSQSTSGYGVYADGRLGATGTKSFRIDHPSDPENKYLLHYSTESPVPQNFYVGNVTTDRNGYAWVELPDYFSEINVNFKYQLTIVDDADSNTFVQAKVSKKIRDNRFQVRTNAPHVEVSWRVDADRNDRWVRQRGAPVEVEKQGLERGTYQDPELYGQPPEKGLNYNPMRESTPPSHPALATQAESLSSAATEAATR